MLQNDKKYYAYNLIQMIKHSQNKHLNDTFSPNDLNMYKINFMSSAIGGISVLCLQEILHLINNIYLQLLKTQKKLPTYEEMRNALSPSIRKGGIK